MTMEQQKRDNFLALRNSPKHCQPIIYNGKQKLILWK